MPLKAESLKNQLNERWFKRLEPKKTNKPDVTSGKVAIACKCPKCGVFHDNFMRWSGRGTPRVYCQNCRPLVGSTCDWQVELGLSLFRKGSHRRCHAVFE